MDIYRELYENAAKGKNKMASLIGYLEGRLYSLKIQLPEGEHKEYCKLTLKELDKQWKALQGAPEDEI